MKAIEVLRHEHELVRELLRCLAALTLQAHVTGRLERRAAQSVLRMLERFVDCSHQDKEELHLFPALLARATAQEAERLAHVFGQHAQERRRLGAMQLHMNAACRGDDAAIDRFVAHSRLYQRLQTKHIESEESYVLPLAEAILTDEDDPRLLRGFRRIDARLGGPAQLERELALLDRQLGLEPAAWEPRVPELIRA